MAIKKNIEDMQGKDNYPCGQQLLIHNGKVLKDESTLAESKISEDGFLMVMLGKQNYEFDWDISYTGIFCDDVGSLLVVLHRIIRNYGTKNCLFLTDISGKNDVVVNKGYCKAEMGREWGENEFISSTIKLLCSCRI